MCDSNQCGALTRLCRQDTRWIHVGYGNASALSMTCAAVQARAGRLDCSTARIRSGPEPLARERYSLVPERCDGAGIVR